MAPTVKEPRDVAGTLVPGGGCATPAGATEEEEAVDSLACAGEPTGSMVLAREPLAEGLKPVGAAGGAAIGRTSPLTRVPQAPTIRPRADSVASPRMVLSIIAPSALRIIRYKLLYRKPNDKVTT